MSEKETSDLSLSRVECEHCGAVWINGVHTWRTGCQGPSSELDLAGLVCNTPHGNKSLCINPALGREGGDTWEQRLKDLTKMEEENR